MTRLSALLMVSAALIAVIALEFIDAPTGDILPQQPRAATAVSPAPMPIANRMVDWVATTLARPLFSPDRRPAAGANGGVGSSLPGLPRLAGIMIGPSGRSAIFAVGGSSKPLVVQEGERVAAYTIKSIEAEQVRLIGPEGTRVLNPSFEQAANKTAITPTPPRRPGQAPLPR